MTKKTLEASHNILGVTLLATGRLILATEKRMYELINNVWEPMVFADDPPAEEASPASAPAPKPIFPEPKS